ncbi:hypothetical protein ACP179_23340 [Xenorhabdus stockiae]
MGYPTEIINYEDIENKKLLLIPAVSVELKLPAFERCSKFFDTLKLDIASKLNKKSP